MVKGILLLWEAPVRICSFQATSLIEERSATVTLTIWIPWKLNSQPKRELWPNQWETRIHTGRLKNSHKIKILWIRKAKWALSARETMSCTSSIRRDLRACRFRNRSTIRLPFSHRMIIRSCLCRRSVSSSCSMTRVWRTNFASIVDTNSIANNLTRSTWASTMGSSSATIALAYTRPITAWKSPSSKPSVLPRISLKILVLSSRLITINGHTPSWECL